MDERTAADKDFDLLKPGSKGATLTASDEDALSAFDEIERHGVRAEMARARVAAEIAVKRLLIAKWHRLENGQRLDFNLYRFQRAIYEDPSPEIVVFGSTQWGKTEYLICHSIAAAACGLKVLFVCAKKEQREKLVKTRFDPILRSVPLYKRLAEQAASVGKNTDSTLIKQIGDHGSIVFLNSQVKNDFISQPGDLCIVDEHQYAKLDNIAMLGDRMSASDEQFIVIVGNPITKGTESNQNLDWQYQLSDQRKWYVPCNTCRTEQVLDWETNVVKVVRNKFGGILSVSPRDETWVENSPVDMKAVCVNCGQPMDRLHKDAFWKAQFPGRRRHGYQLSNLYNPKKRLDTLYSQFLSAQHQPGLLAQFYNNQMGIPYNTDGSSITEAMLQACSTGELGGAGKADPYQFLPASQIQWRDAA